MTPTSKLNAVNSMLATIGEAPVNTLFGDKTAETALALNDLDEVTRLVQVEGWWFNTEECYPLTRDTNGSINVPSNTIRVEIDPVKYRDIAPVLRGTHLYDMKNHTSTFTQDVTAKNVIFMLDFEDMPEAMRQYVYLRAARVFQDRHLGSPTLHQFSQQDELEARVKAQQEDSDSRQANILNNPYVQQITQRF